MADAWIERWNDRYGQSEYAYGETPNDYLKEQLEKLPPRKILFPAEGEGRNAVFAATKAWQVSAFDVSKEGQKKALQLAEKQQVSIDYQVGLLEELQYSPDEFDAIALIYAHFPATLKAPYHRLLDSFLRPGGIIIFEAFSKKHLEYVQKNEKVGGPRELEMLYSVDEIKADFANYEIIELEEKVIELHEGLYHNGEGAVVRFVGRKK